MNWHSMDEFPEKDIYVLIRNSYTKAITLGLYNDRTEKWEMYIRRDGCCPEENNIAFDHEGKEFSLLIKEYDHNLPREFNQWTYIAELE